MNQQRHRPVLQPVPAVEGTGRLDANRIWQETEAAIGGSVPRDEGLFQRFESFVESVNQAGLPYSAKVFARGQIGQVLTERLLLAQEIAQHPEISQEQVDRPIFIVGFPRTGTSLLQSLLTQDAAAQAVLWWQSVHPTPAPGLCSADLLQRKARSTATLAEFVALQPNQMTMHPYWDYGAETPIEDEQVMALDFQNPYPTLFYRIPMMFHGVGSAEGLSSFAFHKQFLQQQQWRQPRRRWVCKGTAHQFFLDALWEVYPDALCLWAHRDPSEYLASMLTMGSTMYASITGQPDHRGYGEGMLAQIEGGLDQVLKSQLLDDERLIHLSYHNLVADPVGAIKSAYSHWDLPYSDEFEQGMRAWMADPGNKSDRYGRLSYSMSDYGTTEAAVKQRFAAYRERFQLD